MSVLIIIPIYKGLEETKSCIDSVITSLPINAPNVNVLLINDCSPEPALVDYLTALEHPQITLLHNEHNLGFVATVNRGMELRAGADVILLNSDTEVHGDWVTRIHTSAYTDSTIATVTPFSNNATICSFPLMAEDNALIFDGDFKRLDSLFAQMPATVFDVPTGVGFCMHIKDAALNDLGLFDVATFGKGYGEENDFCQRAALKGWRNTLLGNTFVYHKGQTSFQESRDARVLNAIKIINKRYPQYEAQVHKFIQEDPARLHRLQVLLNYIRTSPLIKIGCIHQGTGGGVVRHINELADFYHDNALMLHIYPAEYDDFINIALVKGLTISFNLKTECDFFIETLKNLQLSHLHYHHLMRLHPRLWSLATDLAISYDATLHDFYVVNGNPTQTHNGLYIGNLEPQERNRRAQMDYPLVQGFTQASWHQAVHAFLLKARFVFTPSADTAQYLAQDYPEISFTPTYPPEAHDLLNASPAQRVASNNRPLHIVIIGAISQEKGADIIQQVANLAHNQQANLRLTIMGYTHRKIKYITTTGAYKEAEANTLIQELKPDIIWLPAIWPETYSYTLSYAISNALPILAFDIGAFKERLQSRAEGYLLPLNASAQQIVNWFTSYQKQSPPKTLNDAIPTAATDFYHKHYLATLTPAATPALSTEEWQLEALNIIAQNDQGLKIKILKALLKIKRLPVIVMLVDLIPLSFQKKVKRFLSRRPLTEL